MIAVIMLWSASAAAGAQDNYRVQCHDIMTADILDMHNVVQDGLGFIWISSSDGLYRYDGYRMQDFRPKASDGTGVSSYDVKQLQTDSDGNIWSIIDSKPIKLDIRTYRFKNIIKRLEAKSRRSYRITDIMMGQQNRLYMICDDSTVLTCDTRRPEETIAQTNAVTASTLRARSSIR